MRRICFPVIEKDHNATQGRLSHLAKSISRSFTVDFITNSKDVYDDATKNLDHCKNVNLKLIEAKFLPLNFGYRDDLARIFVQYTKDLVIPGTSLKVWKTAAFDDFWGHISTCAFPELSKVDADIVLIPLMSYDETPWEESDVFYTSVTFLAKEAGKKVVGYQLFPVFNNVQLVPRLMDAIIVKEEHERQFYLKMGIAQEKIHLLTDISDAYLFSTVEDAYRNNLYNAPIEINHDELGITVVNHQKFRPQLNDIFCALNIAKIPLVLSLLKRGFTVRELSEEQIIETIYFDEIRKVTNKFYMVESQSAVPVIMQSDVLISPTYMTIMEFAARYGKKAIVYNPSCDNMLSVNGVVFINNQTDLALYLKNGYEEKKKLKGMKQILDSLLEKSS